MKKNLKIVIKYSTDKCDLALKLIKPHQREQEEDL